MNISELRGNLEEDIDLLTYDRDPTIEEMKIAEDIRQAVIYLRGQENKDKKLNPKFPYRMEKVKWYLMFMWMSDVITEGEYYTIYERLPPEYK